MKLLTCIKLANMIRIYLLFSLIFLNLSAYSQACLPDSIYRDSSAGVYPRPITPERPNGGINKKACINKPYDFTFTVVIPDTVTILGTLVNLDRAEIATTGAVSGLPEGISYSCNPPNCVFKKFTSGCILLSGTPTSNNTPGPYKPIIKLKLWLAIGVSFDVTFPGAQFPGEYILTLLDESCQTAVEDPNTPAPLVAYPNPSSGQIFLDGELSDTEEVTLVDQMGRFIETIPVRDRTLSIPSHIPAGIYNLQLISNASVFNVKIDLQR